MSETTQNPPRNGEGDRAAKRRGGGGPAFEQPDSTKVRPRILSEPIKTVKRARKLRRQMSPAEARLWNVLRVKPDGYKFRRQFPQAGLSVDFACLSARRGIEVDGESHDRGNQPRIDAWRDAKLNERGFAVMRIPTWEVFNNLEGVLLGILEQCRMLGPLHHPASPDDEQVRLAPRAAAMRGAHRDLLIPPRSGEEWL